MLDKILNSKNIIHKALDAAWKRNEAIAQNIARWLSKKVNNEKPEDSI